MLIMFSETHQGKTPRNMSLNWAIKYCSLFNIVAELRSTKNKKTILFEKIKDFLTKNE